MRYPIVVDTNVLLVANGKSSFSSLCTLECARRLRLVQESGCVVLDEGREILKEYARKQNLTGQPGVGFQFWKWLLNTKGSEGNCEWVKITPEGVLGYAEFPSHEGLRNFDRSDRKFVAVAIAHGGRPPILQATDSKWLGWNAALLQCGVDVEFLCRSEVEEAFHKKTRHLRRTP